MISDFKYAFRQFAKSPGFTFVALLTLALGIGACVAMFSIVNRIILSPLPYPEADRLVHLWEDYQGDGTGRNAVSGGVARSWQEQSTTLESVAVLNNTNANLTGETNPVRLDGLQASPNYLHVLGLPLARGRDFDSAEGQAGRSDAVILSDAAWKNYFGGDASLVGRTIRLGNQRRTVTGILPPGARLNSDADYIVPFDYATPGWDRAFGGHNLAVIARMKPAVTLVQVRAEMAAITDRIRNNYPDFKRKWGVTLVPLHEQVTGEIRPQLLSLLGATTCVLLIACANVAGLLLARAVSREQEMALRLALGASRWSICRQVLAENLALSLAGGGGGLLLALWSIDAFQQWRPPELAPGIPVYLDGRALGFALALSVLTGVAAGIAPAWRLARVHFDRLKSGSRTSAAGAHTGGRGLLIVGQIALSLILLLRRRTSLRSLLRVQAVPVGFKGRGRAGGRSHPGIRFVPRFRQARVLS